MFAAFATGITSTWHGVAGSFAIFIFFMPLITMYAFRSMPEWRPLWIFSLSILVVQMIIGLSFKLSNTEMIGLSQRASYAPVLVWVEVVAIWLFRLAGQKGTELPEIKTRP